MKTDNDEVKFYTEFTDATGHEHYAVHSYNRLTGFVTSMSDLKTEPTKKDGLQKALNN